MSVRCGHCQERHETVAEVKACSRHSATHGMEAVRERGALLNDIPASRQTNAAERAEEEHESRSVRTKQRATDGMYRKSGTIYKVQTAVHGSGRPYAKRLVELVGHKDPKTGKNKWKFEYAPGFVFELRPEHRLTIEQAKEFGALYGTCCVCGRTLTKEESIAAGIGPVCAGKMFS